MSDQPDAGPLPELTPEQDRAVARLLAGSRHDQPIPADVAARLDDALGELSHADLEGVTVDDDPDEPAVVDLIAHRRRRRNAGRLLLAAAAVIIVGVGVGQVVSNSGDSANDDSAASSAVDRRSASDSAGAQESAPSVAAPPPAGRAAIDPIELTGDDPSALASQLTSQLAGAELSIDPAPSSVDPQRQQKFLQQAEPGYTCASPPAGAYGAGDLLPAYFNGEAVVLALRPTAASSPDATTEADVLECGSGAAVTTFTVTLP